MNKSTLVNQLPSNLPSTSNVDNDEESMIREALMELQEEDEQNQSEDIDDNQQSDEIENKEYEENYDNNDIEISEEDHKDIQMDIVKPLLGELQHTIYVVIIFFIISAIPIEKMIYKYISFNKIPYSDVILKSILAGLVFFVLTKL